MSATQDSKPMYTAFYGLSDKPFALTPDPRFLFLAEPHREALAHLLYGVEQGEGFIAVTGEVGTGKTTLCRTLLQRLGPSSEVAYVFNPAVSSLELLQAVNAEFGLPVDGRTRRELHEQLNQLLLARRRDGRRVLLIVDEAQNLPAETLEQIRLLSNLETESQKLLQIVLIGQPELDTKLASRELRQLRQRITVHWRLGPLSAGETRDYVRHRLRVAAGDERPLFTRQALREVHRRAGGIPRLVNVLCDRALLAGYAAREREIGATLVRQAWRETRGPAASAGRRWQPWAAAAALLLAGAGFAWSRLEARPAPAPDPPPVSAPAPELEPAPAPEPEPAPVLEPDPREVLWRDFGGLPVQLAPGESGAGVAWLQRALGLLGHYADPPSGLYDEATMAAVLAFQRSRGLPADGIVGPDTKLALYEALGGESG